jgi:hypothetical protein
MTDGILRPIPATSFASEGVLERADLQAALRDDVSLLGDDLLVVAEEFGDFESSNRRIDLLCVDRSATIVVVELKRTEDGGHMDLQSIRYAAMVSTMTMDDLVGTYQGHLAATGSDPAEAEHRLMDWFEEPDEKPTIAREVKIVLVSAGFGKEITTTVLWLNELYGLDIRCVRLKPYRIDERLLLDVQQVIPLPEAAELTVQLRRKEQAARTAKTSTRDYTKYSIASSTGATEPLPKRRAVCHLVLALHEIGISAQQINDTLPDRKFIAVEGELEDDDLVEALVERYPSGKDGRNLRRWFLDSPIHENGRTWVLSNQWGVKTEEALQALVALAPNSDVSYTAH